MKITCTKSANRADYFPVFLGNGSLSVLLDYEGSQNFRVEYKNAPQPCILRAGTRYGDCFNRDLVTLGYLSQSVTADGKALAVTDWEQSFDPETAVTECRAVYENGITVETVGFVPFGKDCIVLQKKITADTPYSFAFGYTLAEPHSNIYPRRVKLTEGEGVSFAIDGVRPYKYSVTMDGSQEGITRAENRLLFSYDGNGNACFSLTVTLAEEGETVPAATFEKNLADHLADMNAFACEGYVRTEDKELNEAFATAAYHLRASMTKWSMPTGIFRTHWNQKFFGFDEYFCVAGLLAANHLATAKHVPDFRYAMLPTAIQRASSAKNDRKEAHYCWETLENFDEASPPGYYYDHIFHMAHIPLGAYKYARFAGDDGYLREKAYPMLLACAYHFIDHYIYKIFDEKDPRGYKYIIGAVTDLERLGASRRNAYMTTCSVIATLRALVDTVDCLGLQDTPRDECAFYADELQKGLPIENGMYVPYPDCPQKSIAVVTGTFPYEVIPHDDPKQVAALKDYEAHELEYGNMYAVGNGVGAWYALWKAMLYVRLSDGENGLRTVRQAIGTTGAFREMWEINEAPKTVYRPWFTTSSGILLSAVSEMFCRREDNTLYLCAAVPAEMTTYSFRLATMGGISVTCEIENNTVKKLDMQGDMTGVNVVFPEKIKR